MEEKRNIAIGKTSFCRATEGKKQKKAGECLFTQEYKYSGELCKTQDNENDQMRK